MIHRAVKLFLFAVTLGCGGSGCAFWGFAVDGSGNPATEERPIDNITDIKFFAMGELRIVQGPVASLQVTADDNILQYLLTGSSGDKLIIQTSGRNLRPKTKIVYTLTIPTLERVIVAGSGNVTCEKLSGESLSVSIPSAGSATLRDITYQSMAVDMSGAGNVSATGTAAHLSVKLSGAGKIDAKELRTDSADVEISGAGSIIVWPIKALKARISGAGDVEYKGSPHVEQNVTGAGKVRQLP